MALGRALRGASRAGVDLPGVHLKVVDHCLDQSVDTREDEHFVAIFLRRLWVVLPKPRLAFERDDLFIYRHRTLLEAASMKGRIL